MSEQEQEPSQGLVCSGYNMLSLCEMSLSLLERVLHPVCTTTPT